MHPAQEPGGKKATPEEALGPKSLPIGCGGPPELHNGDSSAITIMITTTPVTPFLSFDAFDAYNLRLTGRNVPWEIECV